MAQIFKIENPAPAMGDAEAEWLTKNFDYEWAASDGDDEDDVQAVCVRVTSTALSDVRAQKRPKNDYVHHHMVDCLTLMLSASKRAYVDLLVWW